MESQGDVAPSLLGGGRGVRALLSRGYRPSAVRSKHGRQSVGAPQCQGLRGTPTPGLRGSPAAVDNRALSSNTPL